MNTLLVRLVLHGLERLESECRWAAYGSTREFDSPKSADTRIISSAEFFKVRVEAEDG